jgi:hypothetical protein
MSLIAQTPESYPDNVELASCIQIVRKKCGALQRQKIGVIREEINHVRCITQPRSPSLGKVGS